MASKYPGNLTSEAQTTREVLIDIMQERGLGLASSATERVALLLDPRCKLCSAKMC